MNEELDAYELRMQEMNYRRYLAYIQGLKDDGYVVIRLSDEALKNMTSKCEDYEDFTDKIYYMLDIACCKFESYFGLRKEHITLQCSEYGKYLFAKVFDKRFEDVDFVGSILYNKSEIQELQEYLSNEIEQSFG